MLAMRRESDQYYGHSSASDPNGGNSNRTGGTTNYSSGYQQEGTLCSLRRLELFCLQWLMKTNIIDRVNVDLGLINIIFTNAIKNLNNKIQYCI